SMMKKYLMLLMCLSSSLYGMNEQPEIVDEISSASSQEEREWALKVAQSIDFGMENHEVDEVVRLAFFYILIQDYGWLKQKEDWLMQNVDWTNEIGLDTYAIAQIFLTDTGLLGLNYWLPIIGLAIELVKSGQCFEPTMSLCLL